VPSTPAFHSIHEAKKPAADRVYHNNGACSPGRDIPYNERRLGMNGYRQGSPASVTAFVRRLRRRLFAQMTIKSTATAADVSASWRDDALLPHPCRSSVTPSP
jgi:hypothetical protein